MSNNELCLLVNIFSIVLFAWWLLDIHNYEHNALLDTKLEDEKETIMLLRTLLLASIEDC